MGEELPAVVIELTAGQVSQVLRCAMRDADGARAVVFSGLTDARKAIETGRGRLANPGMCRGLLTGLLMLAELPADGCWMSNAEVARALGLNRSTTHRYLTTLEALGFLERNDTTRKLRLAQRDD